MRTLLAVLADLFRFITGREESAEHEPRPPQRHQVDGREEVSPRADDARDGRAVVGDVTVEAAGATVPAAVEAVGETEYVCIPEAPLRLHPYLAFDSVFARLPHGTPVSVSRSVGRFAEVTASPGRGYLERDALCAQARDVFPELVSGREYLADDPETVQVRAYIADAFAAAAIALPLQPGELVTYYLARAGRAVAAAVAG